MDVTTCTRCALTTATLWGVVGVVAATSRQPGSESSATARHLTEEPEVGISSMNPWWMYLVIPIVSAVVGWGTNVIALQMTFYPLEFFPSFLAWSQIPDQPIGLGWQGIIPSKAAKMAEIVTTLMTTKLIDIQALFGRLDPVIISKLLRPGMETSVSKVINEVASKEFNGIWVSTPPHVKQELTEVALQSSTEYVSGIIIELQKDIYQVLDLISMSKRLAIARKDKIVTIFLECGGPELGFIERSGFYFGFIFGLFQALLYSVYDAWWILPLAGFIVGFATNYLALLLIFKPIKPKNILGYTLHGAFLKRQQEVSVQFADLLAHLFVNAEHMWDEILNGERKHQFEETFVRYTKSFIDQKLGVAKIPAAALVGEEVVENIMTQASAKMLAEFPKLLPLVYEYCDTALEIQTTLEKALKKLPPEDFEGVLHPAFEEDEVKLILVGGALGVAAGLIQVWAPQQD